MDDDAMNPQTTPQASLPPDERFEGVIGRTVRESKPWWPAPAQPPAGAPNIVFIVLDDVGFSDLGCFGAEINTPRMDALAAGGLRYNNFHVTAMCSPTRACLLTGRNAHAVGVGAIAEWSNGYPGYQGRISRRAAIAPEILAEHGYGTYAIGKWHLSNLANYTAAGPHDHWPLGRGFSRWYGFLGGYVDHWNPDLHEDNHPIHRPEREGYHLSEDLTDHAIAHIRDHVTSAQGRPFFMYLAYGAAHWPHHVPQPFIDKYAGRYDAGWDVLRQARFERQKALGIIPADTVLAPRNPGVGAWEDLSGDERRVSARLQETYAAFMEHTDTQIGRVVEYLASIGQLDNTAIVLLSDNGASGEGGATGAFSIRKHMLTEKETTAYALERLADVGSEHSFPHYSHGWAQVSNTPLKWYKKQTHGGGIRAPLIVHWPDRIRSRGEIRSQYHHVNDVLPTLLAEAGIAAPAVYKGIAQLPLHGVSMAYSFDSPEAPTTKPVQHFEIVGDRAIWQAGWKAVARHRKGDDFDADTWELYRLETDFSETHDLAAAEPARLKQLVELWWREAEQHGVLPLDDRETERAFDWFKGNTPSRYAYLPGMARADRLMVPAINDCSYRIDADLTVGAVGARGTILACGNRFGGFALHVRDGRVRFDYLLTEATTYMLSAALPEGTTRVSICFDRTGPQAGRFRLACNGQEHDALDVPRTWTTYGITAGLTCGFANVPITSACTPPDEFTGVIHGVMVELLQAGPPNTAAAFQAVMQEE